MPTPLDTNMREAQRVIGWVRSRIRTAANVEHDAEDLALQPHVNAATAYATMEGGLRTVRAQTYENVVQSLNRLSAWRQEPLSNDPAVRQMLSPMHYREFMADVGGRGLNLLDSRATATEASQSWVGNCQEMAMLAYEHLRQTTDAGPVELVQFSADYTCVVQYTDPTDDEQKTLGTSPRWPTQADADDAADNLQNIFAHAPGGLLQENVTGIPEPHFVHAGHPIRNPNLWLRITGGDPPRSTLLRCHSPEDARTALQGAALQTAAVETRFYDHIWVMIGRDIHAANFRQDDPTTWGNVAVWCDPWQRTGFLLGRCYGVQDWIQDGVAPAPNPQYYLDTADHVRDGLPRVEASFNNEN